LSFGLFNHGISKSPEESPVTSPKATTFNSIDTPININTAPPTEPSDPKRSVSGSTANGKDARTGAESRAAGLYSPLNNPLNKEQEKPPVELELIFSLLNSQSNKLYHEGYFLKLDDLDSSRWNFFWFTNEMKTDDISEGRPCLNRTWVECFAQLVGTVLSLWDATALDQAGGDDEVLPTFINLSDASLKMVIPYYFIADFSMTSDYSFLDRIVTNEWRRR